MYYYIFTMSSLIFCVLDIKSDETIIPPSGKSSLKECVFVNSALKRQCHVVKNALLKTAFSAILPTGLLLLIFRFDLDKVDKGGCLSMYEDQIALTISNNF